MTQTIRSSHSENQSFLNCRRKWMHQYVKRVEPMKKGNPLIVGQAVHAFIEHYYKFGGKDLDHAYKRFQEPFEAVNQALLSPEDQKEFEVQRAIGFGMCGTYAKAYRQDFDEFDQFLLEQHAEMVLPNGHKYHGYIDVLAKDATGTWWIIETKTAAFQSNTDNYFQDVQINSQISGYMHLAKQILGKFPEGVIYNVLFKTKIRPRVGEGMRGFLKRVQMEYEKYYMTKPYFARERITIGQRQLDRWLKNCDQVVRNMAEALERKEFYANTGQCKSFFGACEFLDACLRGKYSKLLYKKKGK